MKYRIVRIAAGRIGAIAIAVCLLFGIISLSGSLQTPDSEKTLEAANKANEIGEGVNGVKTFLEGFGWEVSDEPVLVKEIYIPKTFDDVYTRYNEEIQKPNGYDLSEYAGLKASLYSFEVQNYPTEDGVFANVIVRDGAVIGGDVCSSRLDGFMHGLAFPDGVALPGSSQLSD